MQTVASEDVETEYVGDEACASCHEALYLSYHRTGMGRSVTEFDPATAPERFDHDVRVYNEAFDLYYESFVRGDTLYQREFRLNEDGEVVYERVHPATWVIGSGNATRSYLMNVNGYVTEMPLTWYVERQKWDLSPGYEQTNFRFSRPITLECMTCHNGPTEHSPFTLSHYTEVALGITCERCHGPGGRHVEDRLEGFEPPEGEPDPTIVNPGRLERARQLSVCQQCHLSGITVFKPGEDPTTFRPGQLISTHRSVFVPREQLRDPERFGISSHAERLAQSACFQQSAMTCTTCHDPHEPVAELGPDFFNDVCKSCHTPAEGEPVCSREESHSVAEAMSGDCVSCHMQQSGTSDIPHVVFRDHWIRRTLPPARAPEEIERMLVRAEPFELVRVETEVPADEAEADLEEAIAYFQFYETRHELPEYLQTVVRRARRGLAGGADDPEARLALGRALAELDSLEQAEQVLAEAVRLYPDHVHLNYWLGSVRLERGQAEAAVTALENAVAVQPLFLEARLLLAEAYAAAGRLPEAEDAYRTVVSQDSVHHPEAWNDLGFLYLQQQRVAEAGRCFERAVALDPDLAVALVNLGSVRLLEQQYREAASLFERAVRIDPLNIPALGNLGLVYAQMGRYEEARTMLERVLELDPGSPQARAVLDQIERLSSETR